MALGKIHSTPTNECWKVRKQWGKWNKWKTHWALSSYTLAQFNIWKPNYPSSRKALEDNIPLQKPKKTCYYWPIVIGNNSWAHSAALYAKIDMRIRKLQSSKTDEKQNSLKLENLLYHCDFVYFIYDHNNRGKYKVNNEKPEHHNRWQTKIFKIKNFRISCNYNCQTIKYCEIIAIFVPYAF